MTRPSPRQRSHIVTLTNCPKMDCCTRRISPPLRTCCRPGEEGLKDVVDAAKPGEVAKASTHAIAETGMPIAIIGGTLLRVAQHFIGFIDFNKAGFRSLLLVGIRMILFGKTTKSLFQLVFACTARYS